MSKLPPALAARLAKRGLINQQQNKTEQSKQQAIVEHEEVIAEDYDDAPTRTGDDDDDDNDNEFFKVKTIDTVLGCPNKYNIYHNCTNYCLKHYGDVPQEPSKRLKRQFQKLLNKFPLKDTSWKQVYEPGLKTFYFWNTETDQVSWLPPNHPDAKISISAEKLRRLVRDDEDEQQRTSDKDEESEEDNKSRQKRPRNHSDSESDDSASDDGESDSNSENTSENSSDNDFEINRSDRLKRMRMIEKRNKLDPMDPASYSDIPKGKWSDGLK